MATLGWDRERYVGVDGQLHGPYEPWQVVLLVLTIAVLGLVLGLLGQGRDERTQITAEDIQRQSARPTEPAGE